MLAARNAGATAANARKIARGNVKNRHILGQFPIALRAPKRVHDQSGMTQ
jgi:hypothetical protein